MVDLADLREFWTHALQTWYLRRGDKTEIVECLKHNEPLTDVHALMLADIVSGKLRPYGKKGGPRIERRLGTALRNDIIRKEYRERVRKTPGLTVIADLAEKHFRSESMISEIVEQKVADARAPNDLSPQFMTLFSEHSTSFTKLEARYREKLSKVK